MARSATETTNGTSKRKESANGKANANNTANGDFDDAKYRDFFWTYTEEPHRTRRLAIIKAHPEVSPACHCSHGQAN
jgi:sphingolipid delta-4 desaturase